MVHDRTCLGEAPLRLLDACRGHVEAADRAGRCRLGGRPGCVIALSEHQPADDCPLALISRARPRSESAVRRRGARAFKKEIYRWMLGAGHCVHHGHGRSRCGRRCHVTCQSASGSASAAWPGERRVDSDARHGGGSIMSHLPLAAGRVRLGGGFGIRPAVCLVCVPRSPLIALQASRPGSDSAAAGTSAERHMGK
jgi:hypothetical protein